MQSFDAPTVGGELPSQPVEKLGMGRPLAKLPKVAWRINQTAAEMVMPEAIDGDPRQQGMLAGG